jgi:hypothetical protein
MIRPRTGGNGYVIVTGLPATPNDKVYELWLIRGNTPQRAGIFQYKGDVKKVQLTRDSGQYTQMAVTVERAPRGSQAPTGSPVLVGPISGA